MPICSRAHPSFSLNHVRSDQYTYTCKASKAAVHLLVRHCLLMPDMTAHPQGRHLWSAGGPGRCHGQWLHQRPWYLRQRSYVPPQLGVHHDLHGSRRCIRYPDRSSRSTWGGPCGSAVCGPDPCGGPVWWSCAGRVCTAVPGAGYAGQQVRGQMHSRRWHGCSVQYALRARCATCQTLVMRSYRLGSG